MEAIQDTKIASTFQSSYMPHNVKACREAERAEYAKNKGKAGKAGEWWGHVESKFEPTSCYSDSFKEIDYKAVRQRDRLATNRKNDAGQGAISDDKAYMNTWSQYRMRKPPRDDIPGKFHDILTGQELLRMPAGAHQPGRHAGRVSIDKLNSEKYGTEGGKKRTYNIISNAPLSV